MRNRTGILLIKLYKSYSINIATHSLIVCPCR
nr:MAG TPA: hypothetical protein [Caudoviricetes sp.]